MRAVTHRSAGFREALVWALVILLPALADPNASLTAPVGSVVHCRVMEVAASAQFHVRLVIFHYRDAADRARLGELLRQYDGEAVQFQSGDGAWQNATVLRLKTCFGRGLLVFSTSVPPLAAKEEIVVRFPASPAK